MVTRSALVVAVLLALAALAGGCPMSSPVCARNSDCEAGNYCSGGSCISDCTPATAATDCASGESCSSFGMCVAPPDAGTRDAGPPRPDGGADSPDLRAACVIAGGTDADGDGYCAAGSDADCDEADAAIHPGVSEVCTPHDAAPDDRAIDENCDGAIDEGCPWYFGAPHVVTALNTGANSETHGVSADGLRIYTYATGAGFGVSRRESLAERFGPREPVLIPDSPDGHAYGAPFVRDELEVVVGCWRAGDYELCRTSRASVEDDFAPLEWLEGLSSMGSLDIHPSLSRDGLELYFSSTRDGGVRRIYRSLRTSIAAPFGTPMQLTGLVAGDIDADSPFLSDDGRTLFYEQYRPTGRMLLARRDDHTSTMFSTPIDAAGADVAGSNNFYITLNERSAEIFWTATQRPWGPTGARAVWRARICRDGPCPAAAITCAPPAVRSPDGLHCYYAHPDAVNWGSARAACAATGGYLASVHSEAENDLVATLTGVPWWLGATDAAAEGTFVWGSGEPWLETHWEAGQGATAEEDCAVMNGGALWSDTLCDRSYGYVCEEDLWPVW